jgi:hypothetical protein
MIPRETGRARTLTPSILVRIQVPQPFDIISFLAIARLPERSVSERVLENLSPITDRRGATLRAAFGADIFAIVAPPHYQDRAAVLTGASHRRISGWSSRLTVSEQPAMSREVTSEPVRCRTTLRPRPARMRRAALTIR